MASKETHLRPFSSINDCCIAIYIKAKYSVSGNDEFCYRMINKFLKTHYDIQDFVNFFGRIQVYKDRLPVDFLTKVEEIDKRLEYIAGSEVINIHPPFSNCLFCQNQCEKITSYSAKIYFFSKKPQNCSIVSNTCLSCKIIHFPSYYILNNGFRKFYEDSLSQKFISFSNETVFEILIFKSLTLDILYKHASYSNFSNAYNSLFENQNENSNDRNVLIYKRLSECWLYFHLLTFIKELNGKLSDFNAPLIQDLDTELRNHDKLYYSHFKSKWLNHVRFGICKHDKCSFALNIDGNHKVTRLTCLYDKFLKKSHEIDSEVYLNCPETPERNSYYCKIHLNETTQLPFQIDGDTKYIDLNDIKPKRAESINENMRVNMKIQDVFQDKNDNILYLVSFNKQYFWLNESDVPKQQLHQFLSFWKHAEQTKMEENSCKIRKESDYPCNFKTRTKGLLLAVYNCGIIAAYDEIFNDETLLQLSFLVLDILDHIPTFIIYDNACHLHEYLKRHEILKDEKRKRKLQNTKFAIDRIHIHNHTRKICQDYNCNRFEELKDVDSVVCEQTNFWFSGFKHTAKHMNYARYKFYLYIIFNTFNGEKIKINKKLV